MQKSNEQRRDFIRSFEKSIKSVFQLQKESKRDLVHSYKQEHILGECKKIAEKVSTARMLEKVES
jgi:hypothetical protein